MQTLQTRGEEIAVESHEVRQTGFGPSSGSHLSSGLYGLIFLSTFMTDFLWVFSMISGALSNQYMAAGPSLEGMFCCDIILLFILLSVYNSLIFKWASWGSCHSSCTLFSQIIYNSMTSKSTSQVVLLIMDEL